MKSRVLLIAVLLGCSFGAVGCGPSEMDCQSADRYLAKAQERANDGDLSGAATSLELERESREKCDEWRASQDD